MPYVAVDNLTYTYPGAQPVRALESISVQAEEHEFVSLIGPSGCGKSTLLRLIADLLPPSSGTVTIGGQPAEQARRRREIGFVFQEPALMPWRTSERNVRLPLEVLRRTDARSSRVPAELLELVGLHDFSNQRPHELSGGMRQRVSIARALTYDPPLLLMDEPFGALDQITRDEMNGELLRIWHHTKNTVFFVTHSIAEAIYLSDRVVVLSTRPGRVVENVCIDLPRPREQAFKRLPEFIQLETRILAALDGRGQDG